MTNHSKLVRAGAFFAFILVSAAIIVQLIAELYFNDALRLSSIFKWKEAESRYIQAINVDPFNEKYLTGYGKFLLLQARYLDYKEPIIESAEKCFVKALKLNPYNADSYLTIGLIELGRGRYDEAFVCFRNAVKYDPNGFHAAFAIGVAGVGRWKNVRKDEKVFVTDRLKFAIRTRPAYADEIYSDVWSHIKDINILRYITPDTLQGQKSLYSFIVSHDLWQFRREQELKVDYYQKKEGDHAAQSLSLIKSKKLQKFKDMYLDKWALSANNREAITADDWHGESFDGKSEILSGEMFQSGEIYAFIEMPKGESIIRIRAKGSVHSDAYPYMIVELDGGELGESFVDTPEWKEYDYKVHSDGGVKVLSVKFMNDRNDIRNGEDRNLFVGSAEVVRVEQ